MPKKLDFLDQTEIKIEEKRTFNEKDTKISIKKDKSIRFSKDLLMKPDDSNFLSDLQAEEESVVDEADYYKILDRKLELEKLKKRTKQLLMKSQEPSFSRVDIHKLQSLKSSNSELSWEISPSIPKFLDNSKKKYDIINDESDSSDSSYKQKYSYKKDINEITKKFTNKLDLDDKSTSYKPKESKKKMELFESDNESNPDDKFNLKTIINNPVKALIEKNDYSNANYKNYDKLIKPVSSNEFMVNFKAPLSEKNKENYSSEASTQTSLVESTSSSTDAKRHYYQLKKTNDDTSVELQKRLKKEKMHQIIQIQKEQHEKRIKALEKLAQLERMHAEKLKYIMLNTQNESVSSLIYDSLFQGNNTEFNETSFDIENLEKELKEQEYKSINYKGILEKHFLNDLNKNESKDVLKRQSSINANELRSNYNKENRRRSEYIKPDKYRTDSYDFGSSLISEHDDFKASKRVEFFDREKLKTAQVEVLNLKNTTIHKKPDNVRIIKESPTIHEYITSKEKAKLAHNMDFDKDGRPFFTLADTNSRKSFSSSSKSSSSKSNLISQSEINFKASKYNEPLTSLKENSRASSIKSLSPVSSNYMRSYEEKNYNIKSSASEPMFKQSARQSALDLNNLKLAENELSIESRNAKNNQIITNAQKTINALEKMSLQEAFETFKYDLVARSKRRQKEIEYRAQKRQEQVEYERKLAELNANKLNSARSRQIPVKNIKPTSNGYYFEINDHIHNGNQYKRRMSTQEIKELTKKNYEKLPEVKQKQNKQRLEQNKKLTRLKSSIYNKVGLLKLK
jgi:hypothetical protein